MKRVVSIAGLLCALSGRVLAWDTDPHGFLEVYHAQRLQHPQEAMSSRARLRLNNWLTHERLAVFTSLNAEFNNVIYDETQVRIHELYADYVADAWDIRAGRQLIIWGRADGLAVTDLLCTRDYTEFIARDFDDTRLPVDALKTRLTGADTALELVLIPQFVPAELAPEGSPWAVPYSLPEDMNVSFTADDKPAASLKDGVYAVRCSRYTSLLDYSVCLIHTWNDLPLMIREVDRSTDPERLRVTRSFRRKTTIGGDVSLPWSDYVFRAEAAYTFKRWFADKNPASEELYSSPSLNSLLGTDWNPGKDWTVTLQLNDVWILQHDDAMPEDRHTTMLTLHVTKKLCNQLLELSSMGYYGLTQDDGYVRFSGDYALTDAWHVAAGMDLFYGDPQTLFGCYDDNSEVFVKLKYNF